MIAKIVIDIAHHDVSKAYDYLVPTQLESSLQIGMRVMVNFNHRLRLGVIVGFSDTSSYHDLKMIEAIDTTAPILSQERIQTMHKLVNQFAMTYQEALMLITPLAFHMNFKYVITKLKDDALLDAYHDYFLKNNTWTLKKSETKFLQTLKQLEAKQIVSIEQRLFYKGSQQRRLAYQKVVLKDAQYQDILDILHTHEAYSKQALINVGISANHIKKMHVQGLLKKVDKTFLQPLINTEPNKTPLHKQTFYQMHTKTFIETLKSIIKSHQERHQSMLIVVPEIDMLKPLKRDLEDVPLIYDTTHSTTNKIQLEIHFKTQPTIVLGTKRAIFLEYFSLNTIVYLEAYHEAYDMHLGNDFHALEVAQTIHQNAHMIYQSAYLTTYLKSIKKLHIIKKPMKKHALTIVSMKEELISGNTSMISKSLKQGIQKTIEHQQKVIILFQRKGYQAFHMCRMCGEVATCSVCHQTLHVTNQNTLFCHTCGKSYEMHQTCSKGHQQYMRPVGVGLDYAYQELLKTFPKYHISKTTKEIQPDVPYDILIGTQKVKQFIDQDVGLTAVLMADMLWNHANYDAYEQAHLLLMNMTRPFDTKEITSIIQTYDPDHKIILSLNDADAFIESEYNQREIATLPPFSKLYDIFISSKSYLKGYKEALQIKEFFMSHHIPTIGPRQDDQDEQFIITVKIAENHENTFYEWMDTHTYHMERR